MIDWLKSVFGLRCAPPAEGFDVIDSIASMIASGLRRLETVGLQPFPDMQDDWRSISRQVAERRALTAFIKPPTEMDWALMALRYTEARPFRNAIYLGHQRYDVTRAGGLRMMIADVAALAQNEWRIDGVETPDCEGASYLETGVRVEFVIKTMPEVQPVELSRTIGFDWRLIPQLNDRLPQGARGRFAACGGVVVFLSPQQIDQLNAMSGWDFSMTPELGAKVVTQ